MGLCSCFKLSNAYLHIGNKHYLIKMKSDLFKKSLFLQRNATYWNGILILFLLSKCYTFWMKVSVCKACTCQLELLLEKKDSCLIVFCGKVVYSVFTAFFRFGKKTESWESFHVEDALTGALVSAGFVSDQKLQIEDLKPGLKIEDWRSRKTSSIKCPGLKIEDPEELLQSRVLDWRLKIEGPEKLLQSNIFNG